MHWIFTKQLLTVMSFGTGLAVLVALVTGHIQTGYRRGYSRVADPGPYWFTIAGYAGFAIATGIAAYYR
jgi:hypothetical protein